MESHASQALAFHHDRIARLCRSHQGSEQCHGAALWDHAHTHGLPRRPVKVENQGNCRSLGSKNIVKDDFGLDLKWFIRPSRIS